MTSLAEFDELKWNHSTKRLDTPSPYLLRKARRNPNGLEELRQSLVSCTIYVGNLSFYTSEEQIYELFSKCGMIKRIIMGLDRFKFTPCGFCFVIYNTPQEALNALKYLSDTKLDDKTITIDLDPGFEDGRQFGRGKSGGQVSDELRFEFDAARGGFGVPLAQRIGTNRFDAGPGMVTSPMGYPRARFGGRGGRRHHHNRTRFYPQQLPVSDSMGVIGSRYSGSSSSSTANTYTSGMKVELDGNDAETRGMDIEMGGQDQTANENTGQSTEVESQQQGELQEAPLTSGSGGLQPEQDEDTYIPH